MPTLVCDFFVPGKPATAGSKKGFYNPKRRRVMMVDDNPTGKTWQAQVAAFAIEHAPQNLLDQPMALEVDFLLARPKGHYGTKGLLPTAPHTPATIPDATKLLRCLEDGLTGVLWKDDSRIVVQLVRKLYAEDGRIGARIRVYTLGSGSPSSFEVAKQEPTDIAKAVVQGSLF